MDLFDQAEPAQQDDGLAQVEGVVERIVYENPDTGFYVARLKEPAKHELTTVVGNILAVSPGETVRIWGTWVVDPKWGRQLQIERYEVLLPSTVEGIKKFLSSGLIKGVGKKYAERIVEKFGVETLKIISYEPERLLEVEGIGRKLAEKIQESVAAQKTIQSIMVFLQGHGIGLNTAIRIYKRYGDRAVAVLRENPYRLAEEVTGIAFNTADEIATAMGLPPDAPQRAEAGVLHVLRNSAGEGHVFLPKDELAPKAVELLNAGSRDAGENANKPVDNEVVSYAIDRLAQRSQVVVEDHAVYTAELHRAESGVARNLKQLMKADKRELKINVGKAVEWVEKMHKITLSDEQRDALAMAAQQPVVVITGGPGTGKTTLLNSILSVFEKKGLSIELAAPTGRAAKRMEQATQRNARTIHRLLEFNPRMGGFTRNELNPLESDVIVIDETSMVDITLMHSLLQSMPKEARLILVGDVDQLPSVGPGAVLMDVLLSTAIPSVRLQTVFRQAAHSGIVANAHRVNQGEYPEFNTEDFFFVDRTDAHRALETVVELVHERIPRKFGLDPVKDVQVLAPMHRGDAGVSKINTALQEVLNPKGDEIPRRTFRKGDKVMQLRNNYDLDVYNGDVGIVTMVEPELEEVQIQFDDRIVLYDFSQLDDVSLAYAATIHKSQGSEYPAVVLPILGQHYVMLQRNVLYTAITRASQIVVIVGNEKALRRAVRNVEVTRRHTGLADRLRD